MSKPLKLRFVHKSSVLTTRLYVIHTYLQNKAPEQITPMHMMESRRHYGINSSKLSNRNALRQSSARPSLHFRTCLRHTDFLSRLYGYRDSRQGNCKIERSSTHPTPPPPHCRPMPCRLVPCCFACKASTLLLAFSIATRQRTLHGRKPRPN